MQRRRWRGGGAFDVVKEGLKKMVHQSTTSGYRYFRQTISRALRQIPNFTITDPEGEVLNCGITGKFSSNTSLVPTSAIRFQERHLTEVDITH